MEPCRMYVILIENKDGSHGVLEFAEHGGDLEAKLADEKYKDLKHSVFMAKHWADLSGEAIMEARHAFKEMVGIEAAFFDDCVIRACQELHEFRKRYNQGKPLEVVRNSEGKLVWADQEQKATEALFSATPAELGEAAVAYANAQKKDGN